MNLSNKSIRQIVFRHESSEIRLESDLDKGFFKRNFLTTNFYLRLYYNDKLIDQIKVDISKLDWSNKKKSKEKVIFETSDKIKLFKPLTKKDVDEFCKTPILIGKINQKEFLKFYSPGLYERGSFFINDKFIFMEKSFLRSWSWKNQIKRELISKQEFIKKKGFMESKETLTVSQDHLSGWRGLGFGLCFIIFVGYKFFSGSSKEYKPFFCNYVDGVLNNPNLLDKDNPLKINDPCEEGQSMYKKYINNEFSNEKECNIFIEDYGNTKDMKITYPSEKWMIGCDKKW